jgi:hypothetical protein
MKTRRVFGSNAPWSKALPEAFGISMTPMVVSGMTVSRRCAATQAMSA